MGTTYKAQALANQLADWLKARGLSSLGLTQSFDTDLNPLISIGSGSIGSANFIIKVAPIAWPLAEDIFGNAAIQYAPHVIQMVTEANPVGGAGADILTPQQLMNVLNQCQLMGCQMEWYESANGVAPTAAAIIAGNLKATFNPDVYYPLISNQ